MHKLNDHKRRLMEVEYMGRCNYWYCGGLKLDRCRQKHLNVDNWIEMLKYGRISIEIFGLNSELAFINLGKLKPMLKQINFVVSSSNWHYNHINGCPTLSSN